ncbi:MAG: FAD-dependent oxidoreductase [Clostridia bacterium]|nr:FAD-dependent oxidoreductase [Clostridia bacterium]
MSGLLKKFLCTVMALSMAMPAGAAFADAATYTPGTYTSVAEGRNGPVIVSMTFSENAITDVTVDFERETYHVGNIPMELYPAQIVEHQTVNVDIVSGATISSVAMLDAVRSCVEKAGGDLSKLQAAIPTTQVAEDCATDVVVVGSGAAGMTAAIRAAEAGSKVILLEKLDILGGTSTFSIEAFGATEDRVHAALGNPLTSEAQYESYCKANPAGDPAAFRILADENGKAVNWLYSIGAPLTVTGAGAFVTSNREAGKMGVTIIGALKQEVKKLGVDVRTGNAATELVMNDGAVSGVKVKNDAGEYTITAKSFVLATGGFGADNDMVAEYVPALKGYTNSCSIGAKGDGHKMAVAVGAQLGNMDAYETVRVNFTYGVKGPRVYYMGVLANMGAIVVNKDGKRFVNDQGGYGVGMKVVEQGGDAWAIFDRSMMESIEEVREYASLGLFEKADTIEELAAKIGVDAAGLAETVETYKGYVANGKDEEFGRGMLNLTFDEAPYYACKWRAHVQGTFGGIVTNVDTEVTDANGNAIPGLYAAGECAFVGTKGANPMTVDVVFGGIAGTNAANNAK